MVEVNRIDTIEQFCKELSYNSGNFNGFNIRNITLDKLLNNVIFDHCYFENVRFNSGANKVIFNHCELIGCEFVDGQVFTECSFLNTDIESCNFSHSDMRGTYMAFCGVNNTSFEFTDLSNSKFKDVVFDCVNLVRTNLSGVKGLITPSDFMARCFEKTDEGYIVYKSFGEIYDPPNTWKIEKGAIIEEEVNYNRAEECGNGINVASFDYVSENTRHGNDIWKCLIRWEWASNICVPYSSNKNCTKIRCGKLELIEVVE